MKQATIIKHINDNITHTIILEQWEKQYGIDPEQDELYPDRQVGVDIPYNDKTIRAIIDYHYNTGIYTLNFYTLIAKDGSVCKYLK